MLDPNPTTMLQHHHPAAAASMASSPPLDLEITIVSAKHLKNVNWRNGDLKPYATFYLDWENRLATSSDDAGSTRPVWNERFSVPITLPVQDSVLTIEIFHSRPSETPKPLVGMVKFPLSELIDSYESPPKSIRTLEVIRPSGRPQGKIRVKLGLKERVSVPPTLPHPDYHNAPRYVHYYASAPPPPARDYRESPPTVYPYSDQYSGYYTRFYPAQLPFSSRPSPYDRASNYAFQSAPSPSAPADLSPPLPTDHKSQPSVPKPSNFGPPGGPSAPVDYSSSYDHKLPQKLGALSLEEGSKGEKETGFDREGFGYNDRQREY